MINTKALYMDLLKDERIETLVGENVYDAQNGEKIDFPCIIVIDSSQSDIEYADNRHHVQKCTVQIHIYTKTLEDYPTTTEIGEVIADIFNADSWACTLTREETDIEEDVRHRVMEFSKGIYL
jgi:hypothetical protein